MASKFEQLSDEINEYLNKVRNTCLKEPKGILKYKFLDPGAGYYDVLWDWDSYFCAMSLENTTEHMGDYLKGCVLNFLHYMHIDGWIPYSLSADQNHSFATDIDKIRPETAYPNSIKPILSQMAMLASKSLNDYGWLDDIFDKLLKYLEHWETTQKTDKGLFVWRSHRGSGTDNHPAVYGRPLNSSAGVELNCYMFLEYMSMASLCQKINKAGLAEQFARKAEGLKEAINLHMWDPIDQIYYHLDMGSRQMENTRQPISWVVPLKFKAWTAFVPMYAAIAPKEYAEKLVTLHLLNEEEFWSEYGVCSLAMNEPSYNIFSGGGPSDWQGPIWVVSNYIIFRGLLNYGYREEARKLAENLLHLLVMDLRTNRMLSEYYDPKTGKGLMNPGFLNWNMLAGIMYDEYMQLKGST